MAIPKGVTIAVGVLALLGTGFFLWRNVSQSDDPNDVVFNTMKRYFTCANGHDFECTSADVRRIASSNNSIMICPQCNGPATEKAKCTSCGKFMELVGHGTVPKNCPFCKAAQ